MWHPVGLVTMAIMNNTIAVILMIGVLGLIALDQLWLQWQLPVLAARMMDGLIETLSFWR